MLCTRKVPNGNGSLCYLHSKRYVIACWLLLSFQQKCWHFVAFWLLFNAKSRPQSRRPTFSRMTNRVIDQRMIGQVLDILTPVSVVDTDATSPSHGDFYFTAKIIVQCCTGRMTSQLCSAKSFQRNKSVPTRHIVVHFFPSQSYNMCILFA